MNLGGIAGIIAASAFLVLALAVAVPLVRMGKVMNEAARTIRITTDEVVPVIKQARHSIETVNAMVDRIEKMVEAVGKVVDKANNLADNLHPLSTAVRLGEMFKRFVPGSTRE